MKHEPAKGMRVTMGYTCTCHYWAADWNIWNAHLEEHWREEEDDDN